MAMNAKAVKAGKGRRERGSSLFIVAAAMVALVGLMGLGVDLVALYLGKSEAQRAADAAALAGAQEFVLSGFTSGLVTQATAQTLATNQAVAVGQKNLVGGAAPSIPTGNVTFDFTHAGNPLITTVVNATLPTIFMKIFGVTSANISATATAEAYNPAGSAAGGPTLCTSCLRPFLVPNCDAGHLVAPPGGNPACPQIGGKNQDYFLTPPKYGITHSGPAPSGIIGESWQLHSESGTSSQWFSIAFLGSQSKAAWRANIASCNTDAIVCGTQPFPMFAGSNNPLVQAGVIASGAKVAQSDSLVTVPVYDGVDTNGGNPLTAGGSQVKVTGYLQMFIQDVLHNSTDDIIDV